MDNESRQPVSSDPAAQDSAQQVTETQSNTTAYRTMSPKTAYRLKITVRVIWFVNGVIVTVLGLRFLLRLLGANPDNAFSNFVYVISRPFAEPFLGLFNADSVLSRSRVEFEALIAMLVYTLLAWGIVKLITIAKH